jgi:hypothetical protein
LKTYNDSRGFANAKSFQFQQSFAAFTRSFWFQFFLIFYFELFLLFLFCFQFFFLIFLSFFSSFLFLIFL